MNENTQDTEIKNEDKKEIPYYSEGIIYVLKAIADSIRHIAELVDKLEKSWEIKRQISTRIFCILGLLIAFTSFLGWQGIISGDAIAFLFGAIIGYLFSFLHKYMIG